MEAPPSASFSSTLSCLSHHILGTEIKPGFLGASRRGLSGGSHAAHTAPTDLLGENPGPQDTVWGKSGQHGWRPPNLTLLPEINEPAPHPTAGSLCSPGEAIALPRVPPPLPVPLPLNSHQMETLRSPPSRGMAARPRPCLGPPRGSSCCLPNLPWEQLGRRPRLI